MSAPERPIRVGVLGPGAIAHKMAASLAHSRLCRLSAVGSRSLEKSRAFAERHGGRRKTVRAYGSYAELVASPDVDLVYVATPHSLHAEHALLALAAGKHVLLEKPFALTGAQVRAVVGEARRRGLFLMEAMWTRFLPAVRAARELAAGGAVGALRGVQASLCFHFPYDPAHRIFDPRLGGGAMLDLGVYPLHLASLFAGVPERVSGLAALAPTGVDAAFAFASLHAGGVAGSLFCGTGAAGDNRALVAGEAGTISLPAPFLSAQEFTIAPRGGRPRRRRLPFPGPGYHFEADEAAACILDGRGESPLLPLDESQALFDQMEGLLAAAGVRYES